MLLEIQVHTSLEVPQNQILRLCECFLKLSSHKFKSSSKSNSEAFLMFLEIQVRTSLERRKFPFFFSSSLSFHRQVSLIHFFTISAPNFKGTSKGRRLRKEEEEVQEVFVEEVQEVFVEEVQLLYSSLNTSLGVPVELGSLFSMGQIKGVVVYAIVGVVRFRGISEIIHRESEFHVFRLKLLLTYKLSSKTPTSRTSRAPLPQIKCKYPAVNHMIKF
uniref:Ty3-gypsy retrotransposon protein n=1 Tax=Cucumis melo TaxID=3656 RepID=A0A9I9E5U3_CUCME